MDQNKSKTMEDISFLEKKIDFLKERLARALAEKAKLEEFVFFYHEMEKERKDEHPDSSKESETKQAE